jgi:hypothetical protein
VDVSPSQLRRAGAILHDLAAQLRTGLHGDGDRAGPGAPAWATDPVLAALSRAWDGYLTGLAGRLAEAGDRLVSAADGYADADGRATIRLGRRLC